METTRNVKIDQNSDDIQILELPIGPEELKQIKKFWKAFTTLDPKKSATKTNSIELIELAELQRKLFWRIANRIFAFTEQEKKEGAEMAPK